jgi:dipeptidyl aminopeptidase/acylaminoacyl peptidase
MLIGGCLRDNPDGANLSKAASPMTYATPNDAPVLTVHGTEDRTVPYDQAVRMDVELRKAGVPSLFRHVPTSQHGNFQHRHGRQSKGDQTA